MKAHLVVPPGLIRLVRLQDRGRGQGQGQGRSLQGSHQKENEQTHQKGKMNRQ